MERPVGKRFDEMLQEISSCKLGESSTWGAMWTGSMEKVSLKSSESSHKRVGPCGEEGSPLRHGGCNGGKLGSFTVSMSYHFLMHSVLREVQLSVALEPGAKTQDYMAVSSDGLAEQTRDL